MQAADSALIVIDAVDGIKVQTEQALEFANAYNLIAQGGWVAFNIKSDFLESKDPCGFAGLIRRMIDEGLLSIRTGDQYEHRLATSGDPLLYTAFVGVKNRDVPAAWEL
jgi:hypothetical protein